VLSYEQIVQQLNKVLQIDIDAVGAYQAAIEAINDLTIQNQLRQFMGDHERHVVELRALVFRFGGTPAEKRDLKGMVQRGFTKVAGMVGTEATLRAMLQNEKATNAAYRKSVQEALPADVLEVLQRNFGDEQRHFAWIESALRTRLWEQPLHPTI
jgi:uncharacterized protein (TIGR02284 family)